MPAHRVFYERDMGWDAFLTYDRLLHEQRGLGDLQLECVTEALVSVMRDLGDWAVFDEWVVMPNHVHLIVSARDDLGKVLRRLKGKSALLVNREWGRSGQFWQEESFDRVVRSDWGLGFYREYIRGNAESAGLGEWRWRGCGVNKERGVFTSRTS